MQVLLGRYESKISEKHQVAFPKKYREILGRRIIITKGMGRYLIAVSGESWELLLEGTEGRPFIDKDTREIQRFLLGNAYEAGFDTQGRLVLPQYLREYAELRRDVIFAGIRKYVEVWDKESWESQQEYLSHTIDGVAERLGH